MRCGSIEVLYVYSLVNLLAGGFSTDLSVSAPPRTAFRLVFFSAAHSAPRSPCGSRGAESTAHLRTEAWDIRPRPRAADRAVPKPSGPSCGVYSAHRCSLELRAHYTRPPRGVSRRGRPGPLCEAQDLKEKEAACDGQPQSVDSPAGLDRHIARGLQQGTRKEIPHVSGCPIPSQTESEVEGDQDEEEAPALWS